MRAYTAMIAAGLFSCSGLGDTYLCINPVDGCHVPDCDEGKIGPQTIVCQGGRRDCCIAAAFELGPEGYLCLISVDYVCCHWPDSKCCAYMVAGGGWVDVDAYCLSLDSDCYYCEPND